MKNLRFNADEILQKAEMKNVLGGVTREEYCETLGTMLVTNFESNGDEGYQGDLSMGMHFFSVNCGNYGFSLTDY